MLEPTNYETDYKLCFLSERAANMDQHVISVD